MFQVTATKRLGDHQFPKQVQIDVYGNINENF